MGFTDLEEQFSFYAAYHSNGMNKLIHILCVWPILFTGIVFLEYVPEFTGFAPQLAAINNAVLFIHPFNAAFIMAVIYATAYILMDQKAGTLAAFLVFLCLIYAQKFYLEIEGYTGYPAWLVAAAIHVGGWIAQFIGHGAFEGRAPALLDNLAQAFLMAPLFVLLEVLFHFGYRQDFQKKMRSRVGVEITKFRKSKAAGQRTSTQGRKKK